MIKSALSGMLGGRKTVKSKSVKTMCFQGARRDFGHAVSSVAQAEREFCVKRQAEGIAAAQESYN